MGKIFCLMGKSASGKDTVYKKLLSDNKFDLKKIVPYTTGPIRENERDGVQYYFTNIEALERYSKEGKVIESRAYNTIHGIWYYFTVDDHQIDLEHQNHIVIGTPQSFIKLRTYFGNDKVIPIYIELDDGIRLQRALDREKIQVNPKYCEMCRRFLADAEDFSDDNLNRAGIKNRFSNDVLTDCVSNIESFIREQL